MNKKLSAEALGTAVLVQFGCGAAVIGAAAIGFPGIALAFGLVIVAAAYGLGAISGAHLNPARSFGPAVFVGGAAPAQLWVVFVAPFAGGAIAGLPIITTGRAQHCAPFVI